MPLSPQAAGSRACGRTELSLVLLPPPPSTSLPAALASWSPQGLRVSLAPTAPSTIEPEKSPAHINPQAQPPSGDLGVPTRH